MGGLGGALKPALAEAPVKAPYSALNCKISFTPSYLAPAAAAAREPSIVPMPHPRLLVIEGNSPQTMAEHIAAGGIPASKGYSDLLRELLAGAMVDICYPGDPAASLPEGEALEGYDGIAITGSALHVYAGGPEVMRQVERGAGGAVDRHPVVRLLRRGLQVIVAAAGGSVRKNRGPRDRLRPRHPPD